MAIVNSLGNDTSIAARLADAQREAREASEAERAEERAAEEAEEGAAAEEGAQTNTPGAATVISELNETFQAQLELRNEDPDVDRVQNDEAVEPLTNPGRDDPEQVLGTTIDTRA